MANGLALSTAKSEITDRISLLDVVYANQFKGKIIDPKDADETEKNFYRGAPPEWLNFHISEQAASDGTGTPFIRRDGYNTLVEQIQKQRKFPGISVVNLFHQPGCGGTTLAMNVLWDLRKTFRSAVLTGSTSDITEVAEEVVHLFTAGSQGQLNTVLLLVNDEQILENLQDSIMMKIAEQKIDIHMPVVILLNCVRKDELRHGDQVFLQDVLSETEKKKFSEKKEELHRRFGDKCNEFHGFNIMQTNFSQAYIHEACSVFKNIKKANRPKKTQLAAFLSLLNAYVPGSYLLESQCLDFFNHDDYTHGDFSLEDRMEPFSHLIITFQPDGSEKRVCMAHPMIAQCCTKLMAEAGVTRSDTARNLLTCLCRDDVPQFLVGFVSDMLTKRRPKTKDIRTEENPISCEEMKEEQERFSRLILDIQRMEDKKQCVSVLKLATTKFDQDPFFPQALARFYYIELKDYNLAEMWAERAKQREPLNSFIADTLGQVHKNHLKNIGRRATPREILQLATKAIEAFKDEEQLAENEHGTDMKGDGKTRVLRAFNTGGKFGYLQVCNLLYDQLVSHNETWKEVLTKNVSLGSVLEALGDNKLFRFNDLINSLRDEVERKFEFFDSFLTYSESVMKKNDAFFASPETSECYRKYVGDSAAKHKEKSDQTIHKLKQKLAVTSAGVLSCLDRRCTVSEVKQIATWWKEICLSKDSTVNALANYILSNIMLINKNESPYNSDYQKAFRQTMPLSSRDPPESHMLALLICWPTDDEDKVSNRKQLITHVQHSYEREYETLFRSRHLRPLFFIGKGKGLRRYIHRRVLEIYWTKNALKYSNTNWKNENIFKDPTVQEHLLSVEGVVRNYRLYATFRNTEIEVDVNQRDSLWKSGKVSFYLGITIGGPVAFRIQQRTTTGPSADLKLEACGGATDPNDWTKVEPEVKRVDKVQTYSLQTDAGHFECSVSALRWVCKEKVSFKYQFCSWKKHMQRPSCMDYMPAGPLLDITVTAGKLEEVHLPHSVCVDENSTMSDMFVVLHVDTCGDVLERVSEVTSSHVKLLWTTFTPIGVMIWKKLGIPFLFDTLIYRTNKEFLTLDVYLVPPDPSLQQEVEKTQNSCGSRRILKPGPDKSMLLGNNFSLKTDLVNATIQPSTRELRYDSSNVFEVCVRNADSDFTLWLESETDTFWTCTIRKGDYQSRSTDHKQGQHFVDRHRTALIERVCDTGTILDKLFERSLISDESYNAVRALQTTQDQMRKIHRFVTAAGTEGRDALYEILTRMRSMRPLLSELEESE